MVKYKHHQASCRLHTALKVRGRAVRYDLVMACRRSNQAYSEKGGICKQDMFYRSLRCYYIAFSGGVVALRVFG